LVEPVAVADGGHEGTVDGVGSDSSAAVSVRVARGLGFPKGEEELAE